MSDPLATVVATYSRRMRLKLDDGREVGARIKGKRLTPVCGDRVAAVPIDNDSDWLITGIEERRTVLTRPNSRGDIEVLAANIDHLVVVVASRPSPDWFLVDRYLSAAEIAGISAVIIYNKTDLAGSAPDVDEICDDYRRIGYDSISISAKCDPNVEELHDVLAGGTGILVGQSGVGKSTLINRLTSGNQQRTAILSDRHGTGRHTTVNSVMLPLPGGGSIIDSPGVRDYSPAIDDPAEVALGYREIANTAGCRFNDCRHRQEPECAVKIAVSDGAISSRRYDSYLRLLRQTETRKRI